MLEHLSGAILAGGRSSRFGRDKALEVWRGKTLLEHAANALEGCAERLIVGGDVTQYGFLGLPVYADPEPDQGSLYGLARALTLAESGRVAVTACDMPLISDAFWSYLAHLETADVVIPCNPQGQPEPLAAIYSKRCLGAIHTALKAQHLKMTGWFADLDVLEVPWQDLEPHFGVNLFLNVNTPDALSAVGDPKRTTDG